MTSLSIALQTFRSAVLLDMHMQVLIITLFSSHGFLQAHWRATAEPASADLYVRPRVDSESLHRSALSDSREMAFVPHKRCLSCVFGIVSRKKGFLIQLDVRNLLWMAQRTADSFLKKVNVLIGPVGYFYPLSERLCRSHVARDLAHVKFIGDKQSLLSYSVRQ